MEYPFTEKQNRLPFDVLEQIFLKCLPESPLDQVQPKKNATPISLCHVCTSWRAAALETPALWSHLHHCLPLTWQNCRLHVWDMRIFCRRVEFLKWWRRRQGTKAPFIRLRFYQKMWGSSPIRFDIPDDIMEFFVDFLSSAQYLDVGPFAQYVFDRRIRCSKLRSLVTCSPDEFVSDEDSYVDRPKLLLPVRYDTASAMRRLRIHHCELILYDLGGWSDLMHLSLHHMSLDTHVWSKLVRAVPKLQWGYFDIIVLKENILRIPDTLSKIELPFLSTLTVTISDNFDDELHMDEPTLYLLLNNLELLALDNFSLYIDADPSDYMRIAAIIGDGLTFTPTITTLTLGFRFHAFFDDKETDWKTIINLGDLWEDCPKVTHLVLDMCYTDWRGKQRETTLEERLVHWKEMIHPDHWMGLGDPPSLIRKITAVVKTLSTDRPLVEVAFRDALELDGEHAKELDEIAFEVIQADNLGVAPYADGWKTWGSPL